jgi:hypothetical protein
MTVPPDEVTLAARVLSRQEASERLRRGGLLGGRALLVGVALLAWSGVSGRVVDAQFVSDPLSVARALTALAASGRLWPNLGQTVAEVLIGYLLGGVLGVAVALLVGLVPAAHRVLRLFLVAFYAIPKIALAPLIVMWFGLGLAPKVLLGSPSSLVGAIRQGRIDAFMLTPPTPQLVELDGIGTILIYGTRGDVRELDNYPYTGISVRTEWARRNGGTLVRFVRALQRAPSADRQRPGARATGAAPILSSDGGARAESGL